MSVRFFYFAVGAISNVVGNQNIVNGIVGMANLFATKRVVLNDRVKNTWIDYGIAATDWSIENVGSRFGPRLYLGRKAAFDKRLNKPAVKTKVAGQSTSAVILDGSSIDKDKILEA